MNDYRNCPKCVQYGKARFDVLTVPMVVRSNETGETSAQILDRYMGGVHNRHLAGLPILAGGAA